MRKTLLALCLLAVIGLGAWRFLAPAPAAKSPIERLKSASPVETVRTAKPVQSVAAPRSTPDAPDKISAQRAQMEERFNDLKEEGRRVRQTLLESDPKAAQAYNDVVRRPEYRALLDRRHQIEAAWAKAPGERTRRHAERDEQPPSARLHPDPRRNPTAPESTQRTGFQRCPEPDVGPFGRPGSRAGSAGGLPVSGLFRSPS
jgi:hypothetical protein